MKACRPLTLPVPVVLKRFLAPECVFILGMTSAASMADAGADPSVSDGAASAAAARLRWAAVTA